MKTNSKEINVIQQIHNHVHNLKIDLPSITVVGPQSSGKSSVLESLINKDILPRGTNLVTRCPLIIHLKKCPDEEYVEIKNEKIILKNSNKNIRKKILKLMDEICGTDKEITSDPIIINMWLKDTLEFTIIDLPGITKVAIGKQSADIEIKILDMVREYITPKNTILLAIVNSNVDISNSEALKICKEVDPELKRTIGVLTKIDLMDKGTNCIDILENKVLPLRLGYVGVINRSQEDIANGINFLSWKKKEKDFFDKSAYANLKNIGSQFLLDEIFSLYQTKVKEIFPNLIEELKIKLRSIQGESFIDTYILRYKYHTVLSKLITNNDINNDLFAYNDSNIILDLKNFKNFKLTYDFSLVKTMVSKDLSIFINDNLLISIIKHNMNIAKKRILELQNQYKKILNHKIQQIVSNKFPDVCKAFNDSIMKEIDSWDVEKKILEYIDVMSNVIGDTDIIFKNAITTNFLGTHLCIPGGSKEDILKNFSTIYLDKQICNIIEYVIKLNFFNISELIEKRAMICISKANIEECKDLINYMRNIANRTKDSNDILKALNVLKEYEKNNFK
ncbi:dynamin [Vairimorpha necatrix]|uniref:Dynamin n=1 Tax=Vairimorpha necatrix TaxID=6039 RepID=A0AAX4JB12_9MICR